MKLAAVEPEFVEFIPAGLTEGKLYVSMLYATTVHLCACGCGNKVVLPLSPAEWQLYFDGESVSLTPSVGNWEYPHCPLLPGLLCPRVRFLALRYGRVTISAGAPART